MFKRITQFAVRFPVSVTMLVVAVLLLGYISFDQLGVDLFPDLNSPRLYIEVTSGERPPEEMEDKFVDRIESVSIRQSGVVDVSSVSMVGTAQIEVEYSWDKDMDEAFLDLSKALAIFNSDEDLDELNISQFDPNAEPIMLLAFHHQENNDLNDLRSVAENYVRNELIRLEGIADVVVDGAEEMEVLVETNDYLMQSYGITISTISQRIQAYNKNISGGTIEEMGKRYIVRGLSELEQVNDLESIIVKMSAPNAKSGGNRVPVFLSDVARVTLSTKDKETAVTYNGEACVGLSVYKEMRYNTMKAVDQLEEALEDMNKALPAYSFTVVENQGEFIASSIGEVRDSLFLGIILAVFVLLLFLRRIGPTFIVSLAIPISIIGTFVLMYFADLSLNIMTLGGLALGAGMLVDNAIVVLENIFRNHEKGLDSREAAIIGTSEVGGAISASTLTTIVVFLPIVYMHGVSGELFKDQAFTVAFSLLCSLAVAVLFIPMLYSLIYKKQSKKVSVEKSSVQFTAYGRFLEKVLKNRYWVVLAAALLLAGGWVMFKHTGSEFMPQAESREFLVDVQLAEGSRLERTMGAVSSIEQVIREVAGEDIEYVFCEIGPTSGLSSGEANLFEDQNMATMQVVMKDESSISSESLIAALAPYYRGSEQYDVEFRMEETALQSVLGTDEAPLVVELQGEDLDELEALSEVFLDTLRRMEGILNLSSSVEGGAPEVEIMVDRYRAGLMGIEVSTLISAVAQKLDGVNAGQMDYKGELTDITLKLEDISLKELEMLRIEVGNTEVVLRELADIKISASPKQIRHVNQNRVVKISGELAHEVPLDQMSTLVDEALGEIALPPKYSYRISGEEAMRKESLGGLMFALLLSLVLVYMVLAAQFEHLLHPFTIILTVPLAVVGAVAVFFFLGEALNIMAVIGIIMLVGIAVNDSIILVDAINQFRKDGFSADEAIVAAGQRRIRPILMTTLTTILALLPMTFGFGEGAALRAPMAWAVIGGLVTSTLLTLVVIPSVYRLFSSGK